MLCEHSDCWTVSPLSLLRVYRPVFHPKRLAGWSNLIILNNIVELSAKIKVLKCWGLYKCREAMSWTGRTHPKDKSVSQLIQVQREMTFS